MPAPDLDLSNGTAFGLVLVTTAAATVVRLPRRRSVRVKHLGVSAADRTASTANDALVVWPAHLESITADLAAQAGKLGLIAGQVVTLRNGDVRPTGAPTDARELKLQALGANALVLVVLQ